MSLLAGDADDFYDKYAVSDTLGKGNFGVVQLITNIKTREDLVVKIQDVQKQMSDLVSLASVDSRGVRIDKTRHAAVMREMTLWNRFSSSYIVELLECFDGRGTVYAVMERCQGTLMSKLEDMQEWSEDDMREVFKQMLQGIVHVHSRGIIHRDIKPDNYLTGLDGKIKLCDFGVSVALPKASLISAATVSGCAGTAPFMPPEMLMGKSYACKVDLWSYGVCMYLMTYGQFPFGNKARNPQDMKKAIVEGLPPTYRSGVLFMQDDDVAASFAPAREGFIRQLLQRVPQRRPGSVEASDSDYFHDDSMAVTKSTASRGARELVRLAKSATKDFKTVNGDLAEGSTIDSSEGSDVTSSSSESDEAPGELQAASHGTLPTLGGKALRPSRDSWDELAHMMEEMCPQDSLPPMVQSSLPCVGAGTELSEQSSWDDFAERLTLDVPADAGVLVRDVELELPHGACELPGGKRSASFEPPRR